MIVFHCPNCSTSFPAKLRLSGISYQYDEGEQKIKSDDDVCHACLADAEKAKEAALALRKKNG